MIVERALGRSVEDHRDSLSGEDVLSAHMLDCPTKWRRKETVIAEGATGSC